MVKIREAGFTNNLENWAKHSQIIHSLHWITSLHITKSTIQLEPFSLVGCTLWIAQNLGFKKMYNTKCFREISKYGIGICKNINCNEQILAEKVHVTCKRHVIGSIMILFLYSELAKWNIFQYLTRGAAPI